MKKRTDTPVIPFNGKVCHWSESAVKEYSWYDEV